MDKIKVIKTDKEYEKALELIEKLMICNPSPDSAEGEQLDLVSVLIEDYEARTFPTKLPSPVDAIKFRMEQSDLKSSDLVPYLGSRSRVSEVLSGKRKLTTDMIRALSDGLGIPTKVLVREPNIGEDTEYGDWDDRTVAEMEKRGYFGKDSLKSKSKAELLKSFFSPIGSLAYITGMLRKSSYRSSPRTDKRALAAWTAHILKKAKKIKALKKYKPSTVDLRFMQELVKLSTKEKSPILAQEYLRKHGIVLVIEPHFSKTYLDGAAILANEDNPIIGLTLRYDRLDNFWFTLMHELAHLALHYNSGVTLFYDEIEGVEKINIGEKEQEADALAAEAILPSAKWEISPARLIPSPMAVNSLAKELKAHPALIAGQVRHKGNKYSYLNELVNEAKVRKYFPNEMWKN